jgi:hypothetical protein
VCLAQLEEELNKVRTMMYDGDIAFLLPAKNNGRFHCSKVILV